MINRKKGPEKHNIEKIFIPDTTQYVLGNGTKVCEINLGSQDILKIEIVHMAGRSSEDIPLAGRATASLLKDGYGKKTSAIIAEEIDYYGSSIKTGSNMDYSYTIFYTLTKHADKAIPLLGEMYREPTFPEVEINKFVNLNIQKLKEELTKNDVITYRQITEEIFGKHHAYGYNSTEKDYLNINRDMIISHFKNHYGSDNCYIFISGKINDSVRRLLDLHFGQDTIESVKKIYISPPKYAGGRKINLTSKNEHQSAIITGRRLFNKNHPDNVVFFLLQTIYGGYFGSRLMTSIREDLGYTYDISGHMDQMLYDGCFYVSTEVAPEYESLVLQEIYKQMDILSHEKVALQELQMVKNYLMGNFMNMLDGPMNVSEFAKTMILTGKSPSEFHQFITELLNISAEDLMLCAQKYLHEKDMIEIVVSPQ